MRKLWDIHGGVHPPENKSQSTGSPIARIALPDELVLSMNQHIGAPARAVCQVGDKVLKGQVVGEAQGVFSAHVHASTSGTVVAVEDRVIAHPSGLPAPCVVIAPDGRDQWCELQPVDDYQQLDHFALIERIRHAGIAGMGGAGFPTSVKLNPKSVDRVQTLILNGTECEPYITADDCLMREHAADIIAGALLLAKIVGAPKEILIGVEDNKPEAAQALTAAAQGSGVEVVVFPTKYPSGGEKQLVQILTGKEIPSGQLPAQVGVLVHNVGTAYAAWRAVRYGEPLIERVTTLVGHALQVQRNVWVRIGTPVAHLLKEHGFTPERAERVVIGGPMMGYALTDLNAAVTKTTNCVLAPSRAELPSAPPEQACIRCGACAEACPAQLLPQQLYWYARADDVDRLRSHNLFDCIECGACAFVCPSAIPLVQYYRAAKGDIRRQDEEKIKSDRARERFEHRKERLAREEAEKEAKRQARKKAAEQAKKQLAEKTGQSPAAEPTTDVVAQAVAKARQQQEDTPDAERKKAQRALDSAEARVARTRDLLNATADDNQKIKLQATLKQAELKLAEAREKRLKLDAEPARDEQTTQAEQAAPKVIEKLSASPLAAQQRAVDSLRERVRSAELKLTEAQQQNAPTAVALEQGYRKLQEKLTAATAELARLQDDPVAAQPVVPLPGVQDAAAAAIAKAQARAEASSGQSDEQKRAAKLESLRNRLAKAEARLTQAQAENSDHLETLRESVAKLRAKLDEEADA